RTFGTVLIRFSIDIQALTGYAYPKLRLIDFIYRTLPSALRTVAIRPESLRQHCGRSQSSQIPSVSIADVRNTARFPPSALRTVAIRPDSLRQHCGRSQSGQIPSVSIADGRNPAGFPPSALRTVAIQPDSLRQHCGRQIKRNKQY
ncbi:MAG: hypothetical protein LBL33_06160, partial [Tannerella sp.]|nr:hypothetical protein [Tannerella sp.]